MIDDFSYRVETSWKNRLAASVSKGMYPTSSIYADVGIGSTNSAICGCPAEAASALFQVVSQRYLKTSIVITTGTRQQLH